MSAQKHTCAGKVWSGYRYRSCCNTAAYEHEGVMYCKTHHPPTAEMKRAKKNAEYAAEAQRRAAAYKADAETKAEMKRRSECFPELLEALKDCAAVCAGETMSKQGLVNALEKARAAIAKATGSQP